jgi:hypothetical protein
MAAYLLAEHMSRCKRRMEILCLNVVEAYHADVLRYLEPGISQGPVYPPRNDITASEDSSDGLPLAEYRFSREKAQVLILLTIEGAKMGS